MVSSSSAELPKPSHRGIAIPIKYVIAAATLVSTFSSMAGGLLMYFEGLKSLEETVAETSASEVDGIKSDLMSVVTTTTEVANQLIFYSHSKNVVHGHTDADADAYTKLLHAQQYAVVRGSGDDLASVGIAVVQHDQFDPNNQYTNVFRAPLRHEPLHRPCLTQIGHCRVLQHQGFPRVSEEGAGCGVEGPPTLR